jgi:hypothetical protein
MKGIIGIVFGAFGLLFSAVSSAISFQALTPVSIPSSGPWDLTIAIEFSDAERAALFGSMGADDGSGGFSAGAIGIDLLDLVLPTGVTAVFDPFEADVVGFPTLTGLLSDPFGGKVRDAVNLDAPAVDVNASAETKSFSSLADFVAAVNAVPSGVTPLFAIEVEGTPLDSSIAFSANIFAGALGSGLEPPPDDQLFPDQQVVLRPIPEPSTAWLIAFGLLGLAGFASRRQTRPTAPAVS